MANSVESGLLSSVEHDDDDDDDDDDDENGEM